MRVLREQVQTLFKELAEIFNKSSTLSIAFIAAASSDKGKSLFMEQQKLMVSLVLIILFYSFLVITGTIFQHYSRSLLPIITCAMLGLGCAVSVMALSIISPTIAWITLALWVGMFSFAYGQAVAQRIKNWIVLVRRITRSSGLLPLYTESWECYVLFTHCVRVSQFCCSLCLFCFYLRWFESLDCGQIFGWIDENSPFLFSLL